MIGWVIALFAAVMILGIVIWLAMIGSKKDIDKGGTRKRILTHFEPETGRMRIFSLKHSMRDKNYEYATEGKHNIVYVKSMMKSIPLKLNAKPRKFEDKYNTYIWNDAFEKWFNGKLSKEIDKLTFELMQEKSTNGKLMALLNELKNKPEVVKQKLIKEVTSTHKELYPYQQQKKTTR